MATERLRRLLCAAALAAAVLPALALPATAATAAATPRPVPDSEPWWLQVGFAGRRVVAVHTEGDRVDAGFDHGIPQRSYDGGRTWQPSPRGVGAVVPRLPPGTWLSENGRVGHLDAHGDFVAEPAGPRMAAADGVALVAAPASLPGVVVAVDRDNVVWRRGGDGGWARALLLLPQGIAAGAPRVTAVAAFDVPLTDAVYLATDGYSVLESLDGGDDWSRAGPGLPDHVLSLAADATAQAVFAGTDEGLWVHHLRATPRPPVYADTALLWRWLGIALVGLVGAALAVGALLRFS